MRNDPLGVAAVNRAVDAAPEPEPARRLRAELAVARRAGVPFATAWPAAVSRAVSELADERDAADWRRCMGSMRDVWEASYERRSWPPRRDVHDDVHDDDEHAAHVLEAAAA